MTDSGEDARRLLPPRPRTGAAIALVAACAVIMGSIGAWQAGRPWAGPVDKRIDHWITHEVGRQGLILASRALGTPHWITLCCVVLVLACAATRRYRGALLVAIAVPLAGALTEFAFKPLFDRTINGYLSFPSGHVTGVSAVAVAFIVVLTGPARLPLPAVLRWLLSVLAVLVLATVMLSVVANHMHYFTDTIGGVCVGTGTVLATALFLDWAAARLSARRRARQPAEQEPAARDGMPATAQRLPPA